MLLFGALGVGLLTYAVTSVFRAEEGWQEIRAESGQGVTCAEDFTFQYYLGGSGISATAQKKQLTKIYTEATATAHKLFHQTQIFGDVANVAYINANPGEVIRVEDGLYRAFETYLAEGRRNLYFGPVYDQYRNFFAADSGAEEFDPTQNSEMDDYFREIVAFANDPAQINLELLGDGLVRLMLSEECKAFSEDYGITNWIDFYWTKNAFVIDYLSEKVTMEGYTLGRISSVDGYARMLSENDTNRIALYDREGNVVKNKGLLEVNGAVNVVLLHDYPLGEADSGLFGERTDGSLVSAYIDVADGRNRTVTDTVCLYSDRLGCGEIVTKAIPLFITEEPPATFDSLSNEEISFVFYDDGAFHSNQKDAVILPAD